VNYLQLLVRTEEDLVFRDMIVGPLESLLDFRNDPVDLVVSSERFVIPARFGDILPCASLAPLSVFVRSRPVDLNGDGEPELITGNALLSPEDPPSCSQRGAVR